MNKFDYKNLTPFKWFVLENFPFIEADFDALTEWQLFCKLGKEINKIIDSQNLVGEQAETLTNAFNNLKNYVDNYFKNLDVQDEINNKLNKMAESGELTEIIAQYLQLAGLLCFNTVNDMKKATNLVNGSFAKTYGLNQYNDGKGEFYKIRNILNTDVVDNINIIALNNFNNLIAEKITNFDIKQINNDITEINNDIAEINNDYTICIGDSFGVGYTPSGVITSWIKLLKNMLNATDNNFFYKAYGGTGFLSTADNNNFLTLIKDLENSITSSNRKYVKKIIVVGGVNDNVSQFTLTALKEAIKNFITYCNTTYPNAKIYIGCTGYWLNPNDFINNERMVKKTLIAYKSCEENGAVYLGNIEYVMHIPFYSSLNEDKTTNIHPNEIGQKELAKCIFQCINGNYYSTDSLYNITDVNTFRSASYNYLSALKPQSTNYLYISKQVINNITRFKIMATFYTTGAVLETSSNTLDLSDLTISNDGVPQFQSIEFSLKTPIFVQYYDENNAFKTTQAILKFGRNFNSPHSTTTQYLYLDFNQNIKLKGFIIPDQYFYCDSLLN